jgi:hypothetical protein
MHIQRELDMAGDDCNFGVIPRIGIIISLVTLPALPSLPLQPQPAAEGFLFMKPMTWALSIPTVPRWQTTVASRMSQAASGEPVPTIK